MKEIKQTFIALLKAKRIDISDDFTFNIYWEMVKGFSKDKLLNGIKKALVAKHPFFEMADLIELVNGGNQDNQRIEKEWSECLLSAKRGGRESISARAAKALNSLGGMKWLKDSNSNDVNWHKKSFIDAYKNTPDPIGTDFRCHGLTGQMYFTKSDIKQLEA